jgi:hypothetical protein
MKKWVRKFAIYMAGLWAITACVSLYSVYLARSTPDWYVTQRPSESDEGDLANQSVQTATDLFSYASDVGAAQRREFLAGSSGSSMLPRTFILNENQLNALLSRWESNVGANSAAKMGRYISDPRVALRKGSFIVAGLVHDMGMISNSVVSVELRPEIDEQGNLWPKLSHIYNGKLPVPLKLLERPRKNLQTAMEDALPEWQLAAGVGGDGLGNAKAATAAAAEILLAGLADKSANAVFLVPCAVGDMKKSVPLRITDLTISDRRLSITLAPLSSAELRTLLQKISY